MFDVTLPMAAFWYDTFNVILFIGAFAVAVGTYGSIQMGMIKERFADERISTNEAKTARAIADSDAAKAEAAKATERAAEANARAAASALELARLKAPRTLSLAQQEAVAARIREFRGQQYSALLPPTGFDTESFWAILDKVLTSAGWTRINPPGLTIGNPPRGVAINALPGVYIGVAASRWAQVAPAATALAEALNSAGIDAIAGRETEAEKNPNAIAIAIGPKPQ